jgi:hypothetical protein
MLASSSVRTCNRGSKLMLLMLRSLNSECGLAGRLGGVDLERLVDGGRAEVRDVEGPGLFEGNA